jgi:hypothetical protein
MQVTAEKNVFANSVRLISIDGSNVIPTTVRYQDRKPLVGRAAFDGKPVAENLVDDFKVDLGMQSRESHAKALRAVTDDDSRSALIITKDFIDGCLQKARKEIGEDNFPSSVVVAEPIAMGGQSLNTESWLTNYRSCLRHILTGQFEDVDFIPEPF